MEAAINLKIMFRKYNPLQQNCVTSLRRRRLVCVEQLL